MPAAAYVEPQNSSDDDDENEPLSKRVKRTSAPSRHVVKRIPGNAGSMQVVSVSATQVSTTRQPATPPIVQMAQLAQSPVQLARLPQRRDTSTNSVTQKTPTAYGTIKRVPAAGLITQFAEKKPNEFVLVSARVLDQTLKRAQNDVREEYRAKQRAYAATSREKKRASEGPSSSNDAMFLYSYLLFSPVMLTCIIACFARCVGIFRALAAMCRVNSQDSALMMAGDEEANDWDARKYPKCRPFMGKKGVQFEHFERDFGAAMAMDQDDDNDLEETMLGTDIGGDNDNTPNPTLSQRRRRTKRIKNLYGHLYRHVADLRLREMMHATARNDGRAAFQLLEQHCRRDITDLEMFDLNSEWDSATFVTTVGISIDTITNFSRFISGLNARRPAGRRKDDDDLTLKFLSCFTPAVNMPLSLDAHKELRAAPGARTYHNAATGQRDYTAAVQAFDELWRSQFAAGAIKPMPARRSNLGGSVRADGANVNGESEDDSMVANFGGNRRTFTETELRGQPICWNCRGFGHRKEECKSEDGFRPVTVCSAILQASIKRTPMAPSRPGKGDRRNVPRNNASGNKPRNKGRFAGSGLIVEDGFVFSPDGACIGSVADAGDDGDDGQVEADGDEGEEEAESGIFVDDDLGFVANGDDEQDAGIELDKHVKEMLQSGYPLSQALSFAASAHKHETAMQWKHSSEIDAPPLQWSPPSPVPTCLSCNDETEPDFAVMRKGERVANNTCSNACKFAIGSLQMFNRLRRSLPVLFIMVLAAMPLSFTMVDHERTIEPDSALALNGNALFNKSAGALDLIVDSGATKHCVSSIDQLDTITDRAPNHGGVRVGSGQKLAVQAVGNARIQVNTLQQRRRKKKLSTVQAVETMNLSNVLVVPGMPCRLFSTKWGYEHDGISTHLNKENCLRLPNGSVVPFKQHEGNHYLVEGALAVEPTTDDSDLTHARLGHFSVGRISASDRHISPGHCEACALNANRKARPRSKPANSKEYTHFGQRIASDTCGPFPASPQGYTYAVNFIDLFSKYSATYFLKSQDSAEILLAVQTFMSDHKQWLSNTMIPGVVDEWFTDNGTEFMSGDIDTFCSELGTRRAMSVPYVPERNAHAERLWGILLRPMRAMLAHSGGADSVKETLWPFLMMQATQIHNSLKTRSHDPPRAPLELLQPGPLSLDHFKVMLCDCYVSLRDGEQYNKLANRRIKAVHLGWDARRRGYFVFIPELNRVTTVIDIDFLEHAFTALGLPVSATKEKKRAEQRDLPVPNRRNELPRPPEPRPEPPPLETTPEPPTVRLVMRGTEPAGADAVAIFDDACVVSDPISAIPFTHSSVGEVMLASPTASGAIPLPRSAKEALEDPVYGSKWKEAMTEEIKGKFEINKAWTLVDKVPNGRKAMKGKWVFKIEYNDDGSVKRFKARWVGCGYSQVEGVDFYETYASTLRTESFRIFIAMAAAHDDELFEADVIKAFTQGDMDVEELYVEQPHEFVDPTKAACRLLKPLEGTRQGAHLFAVANADEMKRQEFKRSRAEPNIYIKTVNGTSLKVGIYVDNLLMAYPSTKEGNRMKDTFLAEYKKRFNTEERGIPTKFMGVEIQRDRKAKIVTLTQERYIAEACDRFLNSTCTKSFQTPVQSSKLGEFMKIASPATDVERAAMRDKPYLALMGTLLWCVFTHPEIAYYVSFLCQFMQDPSTDAFEAGLGLLAYLSSSRKVGLTYDGTKAHVVAFSDSSWGQTPFPFGGHAIFFCGAAVSFQARKLKIAPQSSAEAELAVYAEAAKDLRFVLNILQDLLIDVALPVPLFCDNQAAVSNVKNVGATARTRHYENWLMYGREQYLNKISTPMWISTTDQVSDIFTKALDKTTFLRFRALLLNLSYDGVTIDQRNLVYASSI